MILDNPGQRRSVCLCVCGYGRGTGSNSEFDLVTLLSFCNHIYIQKYDYSGYIAVL